MSRFANSQKTKFLAIIAVESNIESETNSLSVKCKFNFAYFDVQEAGQRIQDWTEGQVKDLFEKLQHYSKESLIQLSKNQDFVNYKTFPTKSDFKHPKHVPIDVEWARFRLAAKVRLVGFVIPASLDGKQHKSTSGVFDKNTFYVVFLDRDHRFFKTKKT
jgi:hypothetical protein